MPGGVPPPPSGIGGTPPPGGWPNPQTYAPPAPATNGAATAALVCGSIALVAGIIPFLFFIAVPLGIAAVVTGAVGIRRARVARRGRGLAVSGLVTGALGILAVLAWAAVLVGSEDFRSEIAEGFREGTRVAAGDRWSDLATGDCLEEFADEESIETVETVPCDQPHVFEVFGTHELAGDKVDYPGFETAVSEGLEFCEGPPFTDYVGLDYPDSRYFVDVLVPDDVAWRIGQRRTVCLLFEPGETSVTGSARGTQQ